MSVESERSANGRANGSHALDDLSVVVPTEIVKRDGRVVTFDAERITNALRKCFVSLERAPQTPVEELTRRVVNIIAAKTHGDTPTVEGVQDIVELVLQAAGEFEAAKHYILYRAEHAKKRVERPIPEEVRQAFADSDQYFPTALQKFQFFDKYSRFNYDLGRRETWIETVDRSVAFLHELAGDRLPSETYQRVRRSILEMSAMPSMRMLAMAGPAARRNNMAIYNCLSGDEKLLTRDQGVIALRDAVGSVVVLNQEREWTDAEVRCFGTQETVEIELGRFKTRKRLRVTMNHNWVLADGTRVTTQELQPGDEIPYMLAPRTVDTDSIDYRLGLMHGIIYGDGSQIFTQERSLGYVIRLCGDSRALLSYFTGYNVSYPPTYGGDPVVYMFDAFAKTHALKELPAETETPDYLVGFIRGWFATDGYVSKIGQLLFATDDQGEAWLRRVGPTVGFDFGYHVMLPETTNFGVRQKQTRNLEIRRQSISADDLLLTKHLRNYRQAASDRNWKFLGIIVGTERTEEVYCATVPETHTFTLADGVLTGNCSYQPVESIDSFVEALIISMSGCGVGFSVESRYVENFPRIKRQNGLKPRTMVVEDSAEGWAEALRVGLETWFEGSDVRFDLSLLRSAGAPLRTKGGRASGPEPLRIMLDFVRSRILARQGSYLRPIDAHDIMCSVGNAAVSGGVRRTAMIALFDQDDDEMRLCKSGDFERENSQRWNANNSAVWPAGGLTQTEFVSHFLEMVESGRGEPGIFNREAANLLKPARRQPALFGTNPCGEITLRPHQFCNLTAAVARHDDNFDALREKVEVATIIGTIQSLATFFPGLRPQWQQNCEEERLLGVDITGQMDSPLAQDAGAKDRLRQLAIEVNRRTAQSLGINQSAAITCVKPSGNSSQLLNCSSGLHTRWAPYYIRNVRVAAHSPIYKVLRDAGVPMSPENGQSATNAHTWVIHFPVKSPDGSITRKDRSAIAQCEFWLQNKIYWTEHNPSCTITYRPDEMIDLMKWVWEHRDQIGGLSFLPAFDAKYDNMPYVEISQEEFERLAAAFPPIDFSKIYRYEEQDLTNAAQELACSSGSCEIEL
ncbi:MAG: ATP cone domain-containing protein [Oscillochloridaceae bacterium umkhey_bin13]